MTVDAINFLEFEEMIVMHEAAKRAGFELVPRARVWRYCDNWFRVRLVWRHRPTEQSMVLSLRIAALLDAKL